MSYSRGNAAARSLPTYTPKSEISMPLEMHIGSIASLKHKQHTGIIYKWEHTIKGHKQSIYVSSRHSFV